MAIRLLCSKKLVNMAMTCNVDGGKPHVRRFSIKSIIDLSKSLRASSSEFDPNGLEMANLSIVKELKESRHKTMQVIINDDILFQELMAELRKENIFTNEGIAVALHYSILESMIPRVKSKAQLQSSTTSSDPSNQNMLCLFPFSKAINDLQSLMDKFLSREKKIDAEHSQYNYMRMQDAVDLINARARRKSSSSYSEVCIRSHSSRDEKSCTQRKQNAWQNLLYSSPTRRINGCGPISKTTTAHIVVRTEKAIVERRPSLWTEETVQDLYEETIFASNRYKSWSSKQTLEELREIETVHCCSLEEIYDHYFRRNHEISEIID
jgi:hypothetical protein